MATKTAYHPIVAINSSGTKANFSADTEGICLLLRGSRLQLSAADKNAMLLVCS